jgi:hypothetical protein
MLLAFHECEKRAIVSKQARRDDSLDGRRTTMILDLAEVRRIAKDVAGTEDPALEVIAARTSTGGSAYIELTLQSNADDPSRVVVVVDRSRGVTPLRHAIARELRRRLAERVVRHAGET